MPTSNPTLKQLLSRAGEKSNPTLDDYLAELEKGRDISQTLVVEGSDDECIYNWVPQELGLKPNQLNVLSVGPRSMVLKMYEAVHKNRHLYADVPIVFIADQDTYLFDGIPKEYSGVVFTSGYSIENDLYSFANLESLLDPSEKAEHEELLETIIEWFAFEVQEHRAGRRSKIACKLKKIVPKDQTTMDPQFRECRGFEPPSKTIHDEIKKDYKLKLRGKTLFDILVRFLSHSGRAIKHNKRVLLESAFKNPAHVHLRDELIKKIKDKLNEEEKAIAARVPKRPPGPERLTIYAHPSRIREVA